MYIYIYMLGFGVYHDVLDQFRLLRMRLSFPFLDLPVTKQVLLPAPLFVCSDEAVDFDDMAGWPVEHLALLVDFFSQELLRPRTP